MGSVADEIRHVVVRFVSELWNERRWDVAEELFERDWDNGPQLPPGPIGVRAWHESTAETFPDLRYELIRIVCDDSGQAAFRWKATGTHMGGFGPVGPTGRVIEYEGAHFISVRAGKIIDLWSVNDTFGNLQQMGVAFVPPSSPEEGKIEWRRPCRAEVGHLRGVPLESQAARRHHGAPARRQIQPYGC